MPYVRQLRADEPPGAIAQAETVSFTGGQCVRYQELFEAGAELVGSYRCALTNAAAQPT